MLPSGHGYRSMRLSNIAHVSNWLMRAWFVPGARRCRSDRGMTSARNNLTIFRSPRSQLRKARFNISVSSRSGFARRCSRGTAPLDAWMRWTSMPRALSERASQKPRPASKARATRVILRPACNSLSSASHHPQVSSAAGAQSALGIPSIGSHSDDGYNFLAGGTLVKLGGGR
jgi:hypothetical protein